MKGGTIWYHYTCRHNQKTAKSAPIDPKKGPAPLGVPPSVRAPLMLPIQTANLTSPITAPAGTSQPELTRKRINNSALTAATRIVNASPRRRSIARTLRTPSTLVKQLSHYPGKNNNHLTVWWCTTRPTEILKQRKSWVGNERATKHEIPLK